MLNEGAGPMCGMLKEEVGKSEMILRACGVWERATDFRSWINSLN